MTDSRVFAFAAFRFDTASQMFWREDRLLSLRPKTRAVLQYFLTHPNQVVDRAELSRAVWGTTKVSAPVLRVSIRELRQALGDSADQPQFIATVGRQGWRWVAPVAADAAQKETGDWRRWASPAFAQAPNPKPQVPLIVGRETELTRLQTGLDQALNGERQLIFVSGEPGIGKTALIDAFLQSLAFPEQQEKQKARIEAHTPNAQRPIPKVWLGWGQCLEHFGAGEAYLPILAAVEDICRRHEDNFVLQLLRRYAPLWLAQLPSLLDPHEQIELQQQIAGATRERMLREFATFVERFTLDAPLVLVVEDLHWADMSTVDLLAYLARRQEPARLLMLGTYRPTEVFAHNHSLHAALRELQAHNLCQKLALGGLSETAVADYLTMQMSVATPNLTRLHRLAAWFHRQTDGHPFFLVHLLKDLTERGVLQDAAVDWLAPASMGHSLTIPTTVRQLLERQMEKLPEEERQVLAAASVAGAEFSADVVAAAVNTDIVIIEERCEALVQRQAFLRRAGIAEWPDGTLTTRYGFQHALQQQLWHEQVTPTRQQQWHRRIGERLEQAYSDETTEIAAELTLHFEQGRDYERAVRYHNQAAENATRCHAHQEAIDHLTAALALLKFLPDTSTRDRQELMLQLALGVPFMATKGWSAPEVGQAFSRAHELSQQVEETPFLFPALYGLVTFYAQQAEYQTSQSLVERCVSLARRSQDQEFILMSNYIASGYLFHQGNFIKSQEYCTHGLERYDIIQHGSLGFRFGLDPAMGCGLYAALNAWYFGYSDQALEKAQKTWKLAQTLFHHTTQAWAALVLPWAHILRREAALVRERAETAIALTAEKEQVQPLSFAQIFKGYALAEQGRAEEGLLLIQKGLEIWQATGAKIFHSLFLVWQAQVYGWLGREEEGLAALAEAQAFVEQTGERFHEAELWRLKGELLLARAGKLRD